MRGGKPLSGDSSGYVGDELALFAQAHNWKGYLRETLRPYLGARVLEVGAGIGAVTSALCVDSHDCWVCLEPDPGMAEHLRAQVCAGKLPACCEVVEGSLGSGGERGPFDTILYVDVLEHIRDDAAELERTPALLSDGGTLAVVAPAHTWLFSPFDARIGHHRRYSRAGLRAVGPPGLHLEALRYLDSAGLLASLGNRLLLRSSLPTLRQIATWDRLLVPLSKRLDPLLAWRIGKSVLGVWRRATQDPTRPAAH